MKNHHGDDCAYPGLELLPDGTFVTTTYGHWTAGEPPYVVSVRFTRPPAGRSGSPYCEPSLSAQSTNTWATDLPSATPATLSIS